MKWQNKIGAVAVAGMVATAGVTVGYDKSPKFKDAVNTAYSAVDTAYSNAIGKSDWQMAEKSMTIDFVSGGIACHTRKALVITTIIALNTSLGPKAFQRAIEEGLCFRSPRVEIDKVHNLIKMGPNIDAALISLKLKNGRIAWALYIVGNRGRPRAPEQNAGNEFQKLPASQTQRGHKRGV
jgi:hypothetical protein